MFRMGDSMDMSSGPLLGKMIVYAVPIALSGQLQLLFNAADLVVVGRYSGALSVAAIGSTNVMINLIVNFFIGFSVGAGIAAAQAIGAGDRERTAKIVHTAVPAALFFGLLLTGIGLLGNRWFLRLLGTPSDVVALAAVYMRLYFLGTAGTLLYNFGAAILRAAGDTLRPLVYLTIAGVLNLLLNLLFVLVFQMDVSGVALATAISQWLSAVLVLRALRRRQDACRLEPEKLSVDLRILRQILRVGMPAGIQSAMFSISNVIIQASVNSFGSLVTSGAAAAGSLEGFTWLPMNAIYQASMYFTGQNYGAGQFDRIKRIYRTALAAVAVTGLCLGAGMYLLGPKLLSLYLPDAPEAIAYGMMRLRFVCLPYMLAGIQDVMTGVIRGMGHSLEPMLISVFGICGIRMLWVATAFQLPRFHNVGALYFSYPLSWAITFVLQSICFALLFRRYRGRG